jgi:chloramphenicol 3-O phosphotransferase
MTKSKAVILLNGVSSSGKTTLASELHDLLDEICFVSSLDNFLSSTFKPSNSRQIIDDKILENAIKAYLLSSAQVVRTGFMVIVDMVVQEESWIDLILGAFTDLEIYLVGLNCDLDTLTYRERMRRDRVNGIAKFQFEKVHVQMTYDLILNSSVLTPSQMAEKTHQLLQHNRPHAFQRLLTARSTMPLGRDHTH